MSCCAWFYIFVSNLCAKRTQLWIGKLYSKKQIGWYISGICKSTFTSYWAWFCLFVSNWHVKRTQDCLLQPKKENMKRTHGNQCSSFGFSCVWNITQLWTWTGFWLSGGESTWSSSPYSGISTNTCTSCEIAFAYLEHIREDKRTN